MSTKSQNVRRPARVSHSKPSEKGKVKSEDKESKTKKDQPEKPKASSVRKALAPPSTRTNSSSSTKSELAKTKPKPARKPLATNLSDMQTSSRVTTSKFFPTKRMYSNAIKSSAPKQSPRIESRATTSTPRESNVSRDEPLSTLERPRTATLKNPTIINKNVSENGDSREGDEYEDDFDLYESDFDSYSSSEGDASNTYSVSTASEEESSGTPPGQNFFLHLNEDHKLETELEEDRKLDSGTYELPDGKHKHVLANITELTEHDNTLNEQNRSNLASLSDEGFEEGKSLERAGGQFINFLDAQKRQQDSKRSKQKQKRGEEILNMIRLDCQSFTLLDMPSVPYDEYIRKYGKSNTVQMSTQTGDDDVPEEMQTETVESVDKWTQFPVKFSTSMLSDSYSLVDLQMECLGVGSDLARETAMDAKIGYDESKLINFCTKSGATVLTLLEERHRRGVTGVDVNSVNVPFSEGCVQFNTNLMLIRDHVVTSVAFSKNGSLFLTVHKSNVDLNGLKSIVCVWKVSETNHPQSFLNVYGEVTCCTFSQGADIIHAGLCDGNVAVWECCNFTSGLLDESNLKLPNFVTSISSGHTCKIIAIQSCVSDLDDNFTNDDGYENFNSQVYTLDDEKTLILWSLIVLKEPQQRSISLVQNSKIFLRVEYPSLINLQCTDMCVSPLDINHIFISTNHGYVLHCSASGTKSKPKKYTSDATSQATCLANCPFSPMYFLTGYHNGNITLNMRCVEKPLMTMCDSEKSGKECEIQWMEWSYNRPCIFYTKDGRNNLNIWDLSLSDIFPTYTIPFKETINVVKLSPTIPRDDSLTKRSYMMVVSGGSTVNLYILNQDHSQQSQAVYDSNVKKFLNYVSRL